MARDESRDIALSKLLDIGGPRKLDGGSFTVWNWSDLENRDGWYRYVPHDQLQAVERERAVERENDADTNEELSLEIDALKKRIAELEAERMEMAETIAGIRLSDFHSNRLNRFVPYERFEAAKKLATDYPRQVQLLSEAEKRIAELEECLAVVSPQAVQDLARMAREQVTPRCKDGCEFLVDCEIPALGMRCTAGVSVPCDGSGWCCNHTRLQKKADSDSGRKPR